MSLTTFNFNQVNVYTIVAETGDIWFVASDIASILGYRNAPDMTRNLDDDEKSTHILRTLGGDQEKTIINESGLYSAILKSRKPEAKAFKKWVTSEVLPSIRKTGSYSVPKQQPEKISFNEAAAGLEIIYRSLNVSESGKLGLFRGLAEDYGVSPNRLPAYTVDAPTITAGSSEPTLPITAILERTGSKLTPISANKKLNEVGLLKRQSRKSSNGELKYYWSITDDGLKYGKNLTSDKNQKETQPHWYVRTMYDLISKIE